MATYVELLNSLEGVPGFQKQPFINVHEAKDSVTSVRLNPYKQNVSRQIFFADLLGNTSLVPWCATGHYLPNRPSFTFDPLFHAGCYYVQEASSMFLEQVVKTCFPDHTQLPTMVLDLCAAPGGKSTHLSALFPEGLVVANEVIGTRAGILTENAIRWGQENLLVTSNDPSRFKQLEGHFDLIVVDAPCSGSGMLRKDPAVIKEWSQQNVEHCSRRQQRILEDVWPALKEGGILLYATCSYSKEEDEDIADWIFSELRAESVKIPIRDEWGIVQSASEQHACHGYRFFPYSVLGEGLYMSCFRKTQQTQEAPLTPRKLTDINKLHAKVLASAITGDKKWAFTETKEGYMALPVEQVRTITSLMSVLQVKKSGILLGKVIKELLIPEHDLAVSNNISGEFTCIELDKQQAITYLQKKDIIIETSFRGWCLATYKGFRLGWMKILPNRINNYYPLRFRILKDIAPSL